MKFCQNWTLAASFTGLAIVSSVEETLFFRCVDRNRNSLTGGIPMGTFHDAVLARLA